MPMPEIARRCPSCGASIRVQAAFCPQCGKKMEGKSQKDKPATIHDTEDIVVKDLTLTEADFRGKQEAQAKKSEPAKVPAAAENTVADVSKAPRDVVEAKSPGRVGARIQKATTRARDIEGTVVHRVQKFREVSSVVLDEASYDPSLRFVLVAGALFLLFLLIVLLNKLIG